MQYQSPSIRAQAGKWSQRVCSIGYSVSGRRRGQPGEMAGRAEPEPAGCGASPRSPLPGCPPDAGVANATVSAGRVSGIYISVSQTTNPLTCMAPYLPEG